MQVQISATHTHTHINGSPFSDLPIAVIFFFKLQVFPDVVWTNITLCCTVLVIKESQCTCPIAKVQDTYKYLMAIRIAHTNKRLTGGLMDRVHTPTFAVIA